MKKNVLVLGSLAIAVAMAVVVLAASIRSRGTLPPQPIAFNHRIHLERVQGIRCRDCHLFAAGETYAGLPSKDLCFDCHDPRADESDPGADAFKAEFASLMAFAKTAEDIPWHRVTALPDHVFFSHRRHVAVAGMECRECHPEMPDRTRPPARGPLVMSMGTCIECHEKAGASIDCIACHR